MHTLLAAVAATPLVTPTPQVVEKVTQLQPIIQQIPQVPVQVTQLAELIGLVVSVALISLVHQLVERGKWNPNWNRAIVAVYSAGAGLAATYQQGALKPDMTGALVAGTSILVALGTALGRYELFGFVKRVVGLVPKLLPQNLATDAEPEAAKPAEFSA